MPLCQMCVSRGVEGEAVLGSAFCLAHNAEVQNMPGVDRNNINSMEDVSMEGSGMTKPVADLFLAAAPVVFPPPGLAPPAAAAASGSTVAVVTPTVRLPGELLREFVEREVLQHLDLVRAGQLIVPAPAQLIVDYPTDWPALQRIFERLAYDVDTQDPWRRLGLAMYEGPDPTPEMLAARARTARLLGSLATPATWAADDLNRVAHFIESLDCAVRHCQDELPAIQKARRKLKVGRLPLHKELGEAACQLLRESAPGDDELLYTQWSDVLGVVKTLQPDTATQVLRATRDINTLSEKGDASFWQHAAGRRIVVWAPSDTNALARCLAAGLRIADATQRPLSVRMVAPVPLLPGMSSISGVMDLWWHPLLGAKWASLLRCCQVVNAPLEMVLPGQGGPRHVKAGLAIFTLRHEGLRAVPQLLSPAAPLLQLAAVRAVHMDIPAKTLPRLVMELASVGVLCRPQARSPLSMPERPRLHLEALFPEALPDLDVLLCS